LIEKDDYLKLTLQDRLISVREAIEKAQKAQSYKINDREAIRANLETLYKREKELLRKIAIYGPDYIEGTKKTKRKAFMMVGANVKF